MPQDFPYKHQYLIYVRKSTDDRDNQKNSIAFQIDEAVRFAHRESLAIAPFTLEGFSNAGIISEKHTGFKENEEFKIKANGAIEYRIERPKFQQLIAALHQGRFKGAIFLCWDRASRNKTDDNLLRKLMDRGVDIQFVQAKYDKTSAGELHKDIDGMFSHHYSRVVKEKVRNGNRKLREEGICTFKAPVGYINTGDSRVKLLDPERSPIIVRLFEKYAREEVSLEELARWANGQGLSMSPRRRRRTPREKEEDTELLPAAHPVKRCNLHHMFRNRFYLGVIRGNDGTWIKSNSHQALVSEKLFDAVQAKLAGKRVSVSYDNRLPLPFRGTFRCEACGRIYTPYMKKGRCYLGAHCEKGCPNTVKSFGLRHLELLMGERLSAIKFTEAELESIAAGQKDTSAIREALRKEQEARDRKMGKIKEDIKYLKENKLALLRTGAFTPEEFITEESRLLSQHETLNNEPESVDIDQLAKSAMRLSELAEVLNLTYHLAESQEKRAIGSMIYSELQLRDGELKTQGKKGFKFFESPIRANCGGNLWFSEAVKYNKDILESIEEIERFLNGNAP